MADEENSDNKASWIAGLVIAAMISAAAAVAFQSQRTTQSKTTSDVLNLPAVQEKVNGNSVGIKENRESAQKDLQEFDSRNQAERNRRESETYDYIQLIDQKNKEFQNLMETKNSEIRMLTKELSAVRADFLEKRLERDERELAKAVERLNAHLEKP